jgi:hypothetical protein
MLACDTDDGPAAKYFACGPNWFVCPKAPIQHVMMRIHDFGQAANYVDNVMTSEQNLSSYLSRKMFVECAL